MVECWKPVLGYEDLYQVSDKGRVRRIAGGRGARVGRILQPRNDGDGYPQVNLYRNGHAKTPKIHVIVAEAFLGPRPAGLQVNHKNGIKDDNRVSNLEYTTCSENMKHAFRVLGRKAVHGEVNGRAKLTAASVREIRRLHAEGRVSQRELATLCGMSYAYIGQILRHVTWSRVG